MSINYETVKRIMKELADVYPEHIARGALAKKIGKQDARAELAYCSDKVWVEKRMDGDVWRATAKGIDASEIMETKKMPCTEIPG